MAGPREKAQPGRGSGAGQRVDPRCTGILLRAILIPILIPITVRARIGIMIGIKMQS